MSLETANNKRIAKNSLMLYVRMLFKMLITLYTSRVVLEVLGVEDFGIYNIVGGIVSVFTFLNGTMSGATSRFLTYALGKKDKELLKNTFNTALSLHICIAVIIFLLGESIGLWFFENKLIIPEERMFAARIVYQFSILSCMVSVTQVPYNSSIISHERMSIYAYVSIIDVILQLLIVFLLKICGFDSLILYSIFLFIVVLFVAVTYRIYCIRNFNECYYGFTYSKELIYPMLSFSGWDLFGNLSVMFRGQGINILQNMFYGVIVNASTSIANQVLGALSTFSDSFLLAVRPQIVKSYVENDYLRMQSLVINASKYAYLLLLLFVIPLILENGLVLNIWLKNVPEYAVGFCQLNILICLVIVLFRPITYSIHAVGRLKYSSLLSGILYISILPITYILLKKGYSPITPYVISVFVFIVCSFCNLIILKFYFPMFSIRSFFYKVIYICTIISILSTLLPVYIYLHMERGLTRFLLIAFVSFFSVLILTYWIGIEKVNRVMMFSKVRQWIKKH